MTDYCSKDKKEIDILLEKEIREKNEEIDFIKKLEECISHRRDIKINKIKKFKEEKTNKMSKITTEYDKFIKELQEDKYIVGEDFISLLEDYQNEKKSIVNYKINSIFDRVSYNFEFNFKNALGLMIDKSNFNKEIKSPINKINFLEWQLIISPIIYRGKIFIKSYVELLTNDLFINYEYYIKIEIKNKSLILSQEDIVRTNINTNKEILWSMYDLIDCGLFQKNGDLTFICTISYPIKNSFYNEIENYYLKNIGKEEEKIESDSSNSKKFINKKRKNQD